MPENKKEQVLSVRDLDITFKTTAGPVHAIRGVNIDLYRAKQWRWWANPAPASPLP